MCGSTDLLKNEGVFVCQFCGCKYSLEEARKMMVEGTVEVQGTVQVDNSTFVKKYLENARRAKEKEDWEETEKYYNMVEQNDPDNIEAIFYSSYGKAMASLIDADIYKRQAAFQVLRNCISIIDDHYQAGDAEENKIAIESITKDLGVMFLSNFVYTERKNGYGVSINNNKNMTFELFAQLLFQFRESILNIAKVDNHAYLHECLKEAYTAILRIPYAWNQNFKNRISGWQNEADENIKIAKAQSIKEYWETHPEEKAQLIAQIDSLNHQIEDRHRSIESLPEVQAVNKLQTEIAALQKEKNTLGMFKSKEKKALQDQIAHLNTEFSAARNAQDMSVAPILEEIEALKKQIEEINFEMAKER